MAGASRPRVLIGLAGAMVVCAPTQTAGGIPGCLGGPPKLRWTLPAPLREVSGLALDNVGRLWLHNDERGLVGAMDAASGTPLGSYRLGPESLREDFEGIAVAGASLFVVTSRGMLYRAPLPDRSAPAGPLPIERLETGVGAQCEIEGLAFEPAGQLLLLACKEPRTKALAKQVAIFRWSIATKRLATPERITIAEADLARGRKGKTFRPSAIERDPASGNYLLVSSADQAFALVDAAGRVLKTGPIGKRHPQPEGLAIGPNGDLYLSDEGGTRLGVVSVYACR